jgi:preprotein translocase subunit YajC
MPREAQLFVILLVLVLFWLMLVRPARSQQRRVQALQHDLEVGQEVVLSSGIFGTIRSLDDDGRVKVEVAPGTELTVARQAVVRRVEAEPIDSTPDSTLEGTLESGPEPDAGPEQTPGQEND